jgi:hypothetical protein
MREWEDVFRQIMEIMNESGIRNPGKTIRKSEITLPFPLQNSPGFTAVF